MNAANTSTIVQLTNSLITIAPTLGLGGILGYWIKSKFDRDNENRRKIRDEKERQYKDFLNNLLGFFDAWKDDALRLQFIWDVYANAPVYASDEVLRLAHSYIHSFDKTSKITDPERQKIYARLVISIRNELNAIIGQPESDLDESEIKIYGLDDVDPKIKNQFLQNMHKEIK